MKFKFSQKSKLYGRKVHHKIDRFAYVPVSEEGMQEYIFGYKARVPRASDEPELYRDANLLKEAPDEVILNYDGLDEMVILITLDADDKFRAENADLVSKCELFKIEK